MESGGLNVGVEIFLDLLTTETRDTCRFNGPLDLCAHLTYKWATGPNMSLWRCSFALRFLLTIGLLFS